MAGVDLPFACDCGTLRGTLQGVSPSNGNRTDCYCGDCRAAELFAAGSKDIAPGPVHLYQTTPDRVRFDAGFEQLAVFSLSPKGVLRWQAQCCGSMMFNTVRSPKLAFAAFFTDRTPDASPLGPVKTRAHLKTEAGKARHEGLFASVFSLASNAIPARITGKWKNTPFFDVETLAPIRDVHVLTKQERAALYT